MPERSAVVCSWNGCEQASRTKLAHRTFCLMHFLEYSRRRMAIVRHTVENGENEREISPEVLSFLSQVISETTKLATEIRLLAPQQRSELIDLSSTAAELYKQIHRAPRIVRRVCCLLATGMMSTEIPEKCYTVNVSQRGACFEIRQALRMGQTITVEKADNRRCVRAKVAWIKESAPHKFLVGVEILDEDDFWGLGRQQRSARGAAIVGAKR